MVSSAVQYFRGADRWLKSMLTGRRTICSVFWTGAITVFPGTVLLVASNHKGQNYFVAGLVLFVFGLCFLLISLVLCIRTYYIIKARYLNQGRIMTQRHAERPSAAKDNTGGGKVNKIKSVHNKINEKSSKKVLTKPGSEISEISYNHHKPKLVVPRVTPTSHSEFDADESRTIPVLQGLTPLRRSQSFQDRSTCFCKYLRNASPQDPGRSSNHNSSSSLNRDSVTSLKRQQSNTAAGSSATVHPHRCLSFRHTNTISGLTANSNSKEHGTSSQDSQCHGHSNNSEHSRCDLEKAASRSRQVTSDEPVTRYFANGYVTVTPMRISETGIPFSLINSSETEDRNVDPANSYTQNTDSKMTDPADNRPSTSRDGQMEALDVDDEKCDAQQITIRV